MVKTIGVLVCILISVCLSYGASPKKYSDIIEELILLNVEYHTEAASLSADLLEDLFEWKLKELKSALVSDGYSDSQVEEIVNEIFQRSNLIGLISLRTGHNFFADIDFYSIKGTFQNELLSCLTLQNLVFLE